MAKKPTKKEAPKPDLYETMNGVKEKDTVPTDEIARKMNGYD